MMQGSETIPTDGRMATGVAGLDALLGGGLVRGRTTLLKGPPGSGKTTLGLQMLIEGATRFDEPGILVTFEQLTGQIFEDAERMGWDLRGLHEAGRVRVVCVEPQDVLDQPGRQANRLLVNIADWAEDDGARRVLIDSLSHLEPLFAGEHTRPQFLQFLIQLKTLGMTPIMTAELHAGPGLKGLDVYLVDSVIQLHARTFDPTLPHPRMIEVVKTRGSGHIGGLHPLMVDTGGVTVHPRIEPAAPATRQGDPMPIGVGGLDAMLSGGCLPGSAVLVAGMTGTFKKTLAAHFLKAGLDAGQPGLWVDLQGGFDLHQRTLRGLGLESAEGLEVLAAPPGAMPVEQLAGAIEDVIAEHRIERVVINGIDEALASEPETGRIAAMGWLTRRIAASGATLLMTERIGRVSGLNPLSEIRGAELAHTVIYLGLVEIESRLEKVISVLKHQGGAVEGDLRAITCGPDGLRVSERFVGLSGVLGGSALGHRKAQIEEIFQPLYFVRDFLKLAADPQLDAAKRAAMLENLSGETGKIITQLSRYFDQPEKHDGESENP